MKKLSQLKLIGAMSALTFPVLSFAQTATPTVDTSAAEGMITAAGAAVATIGAAVFIVVIGIKVWKWMRSAA